MQTLINMNSWGNLVTTCAWIKRRVNRKCLKKTAEIFVLNSENKCFYKKLFYIPSVTLLINFHVSIKWKWRMTRSFKIFIYSFSQQMFFFMCHTPKDPAPKKLLLDIHFSLKTDPLFLSCIWDVCGIAEWNLVGFEVHAQSLVQYIRSFWWYAFRSLG